MSVRWSDLPGKEEGLEMMFSQQGSLFETGDLKWGWYKDEEWLELVILITIPAL